MVVLDLDMPNLHGAQAFAQIHSRSPKLPVIISSGYIDHEREEELLRAGVGSVLRKPYDSKALLEAVYNSIHDES
jgi:DNA-binding NtrC family response regulator